MSNRRPTAPIATMTVVLNGKAHTFDAVADGRTTSITGPLSALVGRPVAYGELSLVMRAEFYRAA